MIGGGWWSTGITVTWQYSGMGQHGWAASLDYYDDGFCNDDAAEGRVSTEGTLRTRYAVREGRSADRLAVVIDVLKADAERLGITWRDPLAGKDGTASLYYEGDGEDADNPPPAGWEHLLQAQAARLGWRTYETEEAP
jgi:hypothetical protein